MTKDDRDLVKAFRIRMADFNVISIIGRSSYDSTILAPSFIRDDHQILHIGTKYGQLLAYDIYLNANGDDKEWFEGLKHRDVCDAFDWTIFEKQEMFLKNPNRLLNAYGNSFDVLLSMNDIDVLHIAKWIRYCAKINDSIYLHQLSNLHMYGEPTKLMQRFWSKDDSPEKIFIEHDLNYG